MGFMFGKSSAEPSLKLHLLRIEMQPFVTMSKLFIYIVIIQFFCIGITVAALNRKVSNVLL
jgi:hypothetical protein